MEDTFIENATPSERLLFMVLDQLNKIQDRLDFQERWTLFYHFYLTVNYMGNPCMYFRLANMISKFPEDVVKPIFMEQFKEDEKEIAWYYVTENFKQHLDYSQFCSDIHEKHPEKAKSIINKILTKKIATTIWDKIPIEHVLKLSSELRT